MITFRYHLVSVIAVFLALALGVVVGSTLIDRAIVEGLEAQVDDVQARLDQRVGEVEAIRSDVDDLERYAEASAPWATENRLPGTTVVVVAERGVERETVEALVAQTRQAGATVPGVLWLNESWSMTDDGVREQVAEALAVRDGEAGEVRARAWREILNDLGTATLTDAEADELDAASSTTLPPDTVPPDSLPPETGATDSTDTDPTATTPSTAAPVDPTTPETSAPDGPTGESSGAITALIDAGVVEFEALGGASTDVLDVDPGRLRIVVVGGPASELAEIPVVAELADLDVEESVPTLVAEAHVEDAGVDRGSLVSAIRSDDRLAARIATVDDLELVQGRVAAVLGLEELGRGVVGHYGYGEDATAVLPEWTPQPAG